MFSKALPESEGKELEGWYGGGEVWEGAVGGVNAW